MGFAGCSSDAGKSGAQAGAGGTAMGGRDGGGGNASGSGGKGGAVGAAGSGGQDASVSDSGSYDGKPAPVEAGTDVGVPVIPMATRGASLPFVEHEAEDATTNGVVIGPSRKFGEIAAEASGRRAVRLEAIGQQVEFQLRQPANSIVVRYVIPDGPAGGGTKATLGVYVNGARKADLQLDSRHAWIYGDADAQGQGSDQPSGVTPHHFYDEAHVRFDDVPAGSKIALRRDAQDTAAYYVVDLVDFELVAPPLPRPADSLSIVDFGATANDASDDGPAIQKAIDAAQAQGKVLWIPPGTFESTKLPWNINGITMRGAGMWHSTLHGFFAQFKVTGNNNRLSDFAIFGDVTWRDDQSGDCGFDGPAGTGSRLDNIWIEHQKVGWWVGKGALVGQVTKPLTDGLVIHGVRIRNTLADGINFANGTRNSVIEQSHFRNTGDDSIATWSYAADGPVPCENIVFRFNTVQTVWRATCIATYGGKDITIEDNVCADTSNYPGILVSTTFTPIAPTGTTLVQRNTIVRGGGPHYNQEFGAFRIFADQTPIANVQVKDLLIEAATFSAIHFGGSQSTTGVVFDGIVVKDPGTVGMWITSEAKGSIQAANVSMNTSIDKGLKNDAPNTFMIQRNAGNTGW